MMKFYRLRSPLPNRSFMNLCFYFVKSIFSLEVAFRPLPAEAGGSSAAPPRLLRGSSVAPPRLLRGSSAAPPRLLRGSSAAPPLAGASMCEDADPSFLPCQILCAGAVLRSRRPLKCRACRCFLTLQKVGVFSS